MKVLHAALFAAALGAADARALRSFFTSNVDAASAVEGIEEIEEVESETAAADGGRSLQGNGCTGPVPPPPAWHPTRPDGSWPNGFCILTVDCNSPAYDTQLACCNGAFGGQVSGVCLGTLPSPPTISPTETGPLDVYYPNYLSDWSEGFCVNTRPLPSGRPTYDTMLACCQGAYGGQLSGACVSMLPSPPTGAPTETGPLDVYYADYDNQPSWAEGFCINTRPLPSGRPTFDTMLACCQGAYGGQVSGKCVSMLPSPPTATPTETGPLDVYYADYENQPSWAEGFCINTRPLPSGRPTYDTMLACCQGAYGGQVSGKCVSMLPSPPTAAPTETGELDVYYPDYDQPSWFEGFCINTRPLPSGRPTYDTMLACCQGAYGGQISGKCVSMLPSPPTAAPTETGALDVYYPNYLPDWSEGFCVNTRPLPSGRPTFDTMLACCQGAYGGQISGTCVSMLPSPPTVAPTETGPLDVYYPNYLTDWSVGFCINTRPMPSGRPTYDTMLACCNGAYGGQLSGTCLSMLPSPPTAAPTETGPLDVYYADYDNQPSWAEGFCTNARPLPSGRPTFDTMLACCNGAYGGQVSGTCISMLPSPPTGAPTETGPLDVYYADYDNQPSWAEGFCTNASPLPSGRTTYDTMLACCQGAYAGQTSGTCISMLPSPPTGAPTDNGLLDVYYADYDNQPSWAEGFCTNAPPLPSGRTTFDTMLACCNSAYGGQTSGTCISMLPSPPTVAPSDAVGLESIPLEFYPDYANTIWSEGVCISDTPVPSGRPVSPTKEACCEQNYGGQVSNACLCDALGVCFSCRCGSQAERDAVGGCPNLICS